MSAQFHAEACSSEKCQMQADWEEDPAEGAIWAPGGQQETGAQVRQAGTPRAAAATRPNQPSPQRAAAAHPVRVPAGQGDAAQQAAPRQQQARGNAPARPAVGGATAAAPAEQSAQASPAQPQPAAPQGHIPHKAAAKKLFTAEAAMVISSADALQHPCVRRCCLWPLHTGRGLAPTPLHPWCPRVLCDASQA